MFTFNKSWTSNIWKHIGRESSHSCSQFSGTPAHTSPDIQWKLLSVSLDPAEGKSSVGWKGRCGFGEKSAFCPRLWKPGIKTTFSPPAGCKLQSYVACWCVCWRDEWTHFKRSNYSEASKHTPVWGDKERFWQRAISHAAFKKHKQECALYRYGFTGKWQKNPSKFQSWQRSVCASIQFLTEKQRHMVTQLAAFANKCRWHLASSGKGNLMKAALF